METRVALIGIIVETPDSVGELNAILHDYGKYIIGRMGIPYRQRGICQADWHCLRFWAA